MSAQAVIKIDPRRIIIVAENGTATPYCLGWDYTDSTSHNLLTLRKGMEVQKEEKKIEEPKTWPNGKPRKPWEMGMK